MKGLKTTLVSILAIGLLAGSAVGVVAQDEDPMAPSAFSGLAEADEEPQFSTDPDTGLELVVIPSWEVTDSRASGTWTQLDDGTRVEVDGLGYFVGGSSVRLANDGGAWVGTLRLVSSRDSDGEGSVGAFTELAGEGGYEGLSLFIFETVGPEGLVSNAFIVPTEIVPTMPPPPAAE